jgi:hypothetical protein
MKEFFKTMLGAFVLGAIVAYFFGPFWFWVIMVLVFFVGIQAARKEKKYPARFGGFPDIVTEPNPKSRSQSAYKAENAAERPSSRGHHHLRRQRVHRGRRRSDHPLARRGRGSARKRLRVPAGQRTDVGQLSGRGVPVPNRLLMGMSN